jgi:hypothetical protein
MCNLDDFAKTLRDDRHRRIFDYWRSKAPEGRLPGRQDIDPLEVPNLLPWLTLVDASWEGEGEVARLRLRCRLIGTEVVTRFGRDITGLYAEEAYPEDYLAKVRETYGAMIESRRPHLSRHQIPIEGREHAEYDRLILPLAKDGETVDMFLTCFAFDVRGGDWSGAEGPDNAL